MAATELGYGFVLRTAVSPAPGCAPAEMMSEKGLVVPLAKRGGSVGPRVAAAAPRIAVDWQGAAALR
jgi:hypothetical protein